MDGFFQQLDRFLAGLTPGGFGSLASDLSRRDVLTREEHRAVHEQMEASGREEARRRLVAILRSKRDVAKLKAVSQALQEFKKLQQSISQKEEERREERKERKQRASVKLPRSESKDAMEIAILEKFENGVLPHSELAKHLQDASRLFDLTTITNFEGKTLLHLACCLFTVKTVELLVESYAFALSAKDNEGNTPLHDGCRCQKTQIVKYLFTRSTVLPNAQNNDGNTPLHVAILHSHWTLARVLLGFKGVRVPIENNEGETPLSLVDMQLVSPDTKKMKKDLSCHSSMKSLAKFKRQDSSKEFKNPLETAKKNIHFSESINAVLRRPASAPPTSPPDTPVFKVQLDVYEESPALKVEAEMRTPASSVFAKPSDRPAAKPPSVFDKPASFSDKSPSVFDKPASFHDKPTSVFDIPASFPAKSSSLFDKPASYPHKPASLPAAKASSLSVKPSSSLSVKPQSPVAAASLSLRVPSELPASTCTLAVPPVPRKGVKISEEVEVVEIEVIDHEEEKKKKKTNYSGSWAACLTSNPPVICVLLVMLVGIVLGCVVIGIAGGLLF